MTYRLMIYRMVDAAVECEPETVMRGQKPGKNNATPSKLSIAMAGRRDMDQTFR